MVCVCAHVWRVYICVCMCIGGTRVCVSHNESVSELDPPSASRLSWL